MTRYSYSIKMQSICDAILGHAMQFCKTKDILNFSKTNKFFYENIWKSIFLWKMILKRDYYNAFAYLNLILENPSDANLEEKELYMYNYTYRNPVCFPISTGDAGIPEKEWEEYETWNFPQQLLDRMSYQLPKRVRNGDIVILVEQEGHRGEGIYIYHDGKIQLLDWSRNIWSEYYGDLHRSLMIGDHFLPTAWNNMDVSPIRYIDMKKYGNQIRKNILCIENDDNTYISSFLSILGKVDIVFTITNDIEFQGFKSLDSVNKFLSDSYPIFFGYADGTLHDDYNNENTIFYILQ